ncbi:MAG: antitoxin family protein [Chroococcidiopsidaceae cyanobacterium CP_BM_ER_R8_30]|nr:antitoxin family protein [Chroococcidiopsidaceae cyanobacterium CP_BM_ER_R8_30]
MSEIITDVYENGVLRPLSSLPLQEHQTVRLQVLNSEPSTDVQQVIQSLIEAGVVTPPPHRNDIEPVSEEARWELAQKLGQCPGKPLSEIIIEDRGPY